MPRSSSLFVDTSGWGCYIDSNEPLHAATRTVYQQAIAQTRGIVTSNYIIAELAALLQSHTRLPRAEIVAFIDVLKSSPHIETIYIDPALDAEAWALYKARLDKTWSLVDASSFVIMRQYGMMEALTTDHHFEQAGFIRLPS
ncbi:MAG TPA: PIN domain-containing protein [Ktedonobacterales bacterium]